MKFDPSPSATKYDYQFPRILEAWDWLDENNFEETRDTDTYVWRRAQIWRAEIHREQNDQNGEKPCWLHVFKW